MKSSCTNFWRGLDQSMAEHPVKVARAIDINAVISSIRSWRERMEENDPDLSCIKLRADLVLLDVCDLFDLTDKERAQALGAELTEALNSFVDEETWLQSM